MRVDKTHERLTAIARELPSCARDFFEGIADRTSVKTRLAYAYDLRVFFSWMIENIPLVQGIKLNQISPSDVDSLTARDIEKYQTYLGLYSCKGDERTNTAQGKMRKLSSLRSFYKYLFLHELVKGNTASLIPLPKLRDKPIVRLEPDESARMLDLTESGQSLGGRQLAYHGKLAVRDTAILTLMLGTGIRVSECVGLDMRDINFAENAFRVTRKGGDSVVLYFADEVSDALRLYMTERKQIKEVSGHEGALFLSLQRKRLTARAVENLTKKYARGAAPLKHITPHKLRSTYGTELYRASGDIYLVADVLGHADVNTTRKHYAAINEDRRRSAAGFVKIRD
ncbi:MAG: tyrosine-type recombinase/integrase [Oscillospiraceae bacterium]|jgi:site-specific recombinase XerD|nr:tyrosine-type recombinase/integrase [Oscillospiraceae bacterium]